MARLCPGAAAGRQRADGGGHGTGGGHDADDGDSGDGDSGDGDSGGGEPSRVLKDKISRAATALDRNDYARADAAFATALGDEGWPALDSATRRAVLNGAAVAAAATGNASRAIAMSREATALADSSADDWIARFAVAVGVQDAADARLALTTIARRYAPALADLEPAQVVWVLGEARASPDKAAYFTLADRLYRARYVPGDGASVDFAWRDPCLDYLQRGDLPTAAAVLGDIESPHDLVMVAADRRFAPLHGAKTNPAAVSAAAAALAARYEADVRAHPRSLAAVTALGRAWLDLGRNEDVLALTSQTVARGRSGFLDGDVRFVRVIDYRCQAIARLGRADEAMQCRNEAVDEAGGAKNSERLALAALYNSLGRANEARATLATIDAAKESADGRADIALNHLRAACRLGDLNGVAAALEQLKATAPALPAALIEGYLLAGEPARAAAVLIAQLQDPRSRPAALLEIQEFEGAPEGPLDRETAARRAALVARADVMAALAPLGTVRRYPIRRRD